jgi:hypothetical protein
MSFETKHLAWLKCYPRKIFFMSFETKNLALFKCYPHKIFFMSFETKDTTSYAHKMFFTSFNAPGKKSVHHEVEPSTHSGRTYASLAHETQRKRSVLGTCETLMLRSAHAQYSGVAQASAAHMLIHQHTRPQCPTRTYSCCQCQQFLWQLPGPRGRGRAQAACAHAEAYITASILQPIVLCILQRSV